MNDMSQRRVLQRWLAIGAVALAAIVFFELDTLLGGIQGGGLRSYGSTVFTAPRFPPLDTAELSAALRLWFGEGHRDLAGLLVKTHAVTDALFIAGYAVLLWRTINRLARVEPVIQIRPAQGRRLVVLLVAVDAAETTLTFFLPAVSLAALQLLTFAKWGLVAAVGGWLVVAWLKTRVGASGEKRPGSRQGAQLLASATSPVVIVATVFIVLVAFPGEGALAQLPDVLRYQFTDAPWWVAALSAAALALLIASVAIGGLLATEPVAPTEPSTVALLTGVGIVSGTLFVAASWANAQPTWGPLAPAIVLGVVALIAFSRGPPDVIGEKGSVVERDDARGSRAGYIAGIVAVGGGLGLVRAAAAPLLVGVERYPAVEWLIPLGVVMAVVLATRWLAMEAELRPLRLVVVILMAVMLVSGVVVTDGLLWVGALGIATAAVGGHLTWLGVSAVASPIGADMPSMARRFLFAPVAIVATLAFGSLLALPVLAAQVGTTGALAIGLGFVALLAGSLVWLSRRFRPWWVTEAAGLGPRPPWGSLLIVAWLVASPLTDAGYHDARVIEGTEPSYRYSALSRPGSGSAALQAWLETQQGCDVPGDDGSPVYPMLLVAAPGGGIRAAYWTGSVLDRLTAGTDPCADTRVFMLSGVSGGGVGIATWLAARDVGVETRELVTAMSADKALAASAVGLFRDVAHPLLGFADLWRDRADLLEDGWVQTARTSATCPFSIVAESGECSLASDELLGWADLETSGDWAPVVVLNGSSVADACRVVSTNAARLPASPGLDCLDTDDARGPLTGSTDPRANLVVPGTEVAGRRCPRPNGDVPLITSALLGARFPIVSPSGAVHGCHIRRIQEAENVSRSEAFVSRTFVVDGGYYENSGLLSLLGVWTEVEAAIQEHNAGAVEEGAPAIEPWIVVASNSYTSSVQVTPPGRPPEALLPITTYLGLRTVFGQAAFEQLAITLMEDFVAHPCGPGHAADAACFDARSGLVVIAPAQGPTVAAPLGWVLSRATRADLDRNLDEASETDSYRRLARALDIPAEMS